VPNLGKIALGEIQRRREKAGIPEMVVDAALAIRSKTGATYRERIEAAKTERQLSDFYEEMIDRVPARAHLLRRPESGALRAGPCR
jgi:hypothetical protein